MNVAELASNWTRAGPPRHQYSDEIGYNQPAQDGWQYWHFVPSIQREIIMQSKLIPAPVRLPVATSVP